MRRKPNLMIFPFDVDEQEVVKKAPPCYLQHPQLRIGHGTLIGGSCRDPFPAADINIGLDRWVMTPTSRRLPWRKHGVTELLLPIRDGGVPEGEAAALEFQAAVNWVVDNLANGEYVHVGCQGGHGRTGLFLTAVVARACALGCMGATAPDRDLLRRHDFIQWVRKHYCAKAVETMEQVLFLVENYDANFAVHLREPPPSKPVSKRARLRKIK